MTAVAGMGLGNAAAMALSLAGAGALLAASALAFTTLKWAGALVLIGLGLYTLLRAERDQPAVTPPVAPRPMFWSTVAVGTLHPTTLLFFLAFTPQFISASAPYLPQAALLLMTFCATAVVTDTLYALAASRARAALVGPAMRRWAGRASGGLLIGAGLATAALRRP